jgi:tetratricopeptide (TPR) repeat protein
MQCLSKKLVVVFAAFAVTIGVAFAEDEIQRWTASVPLRGTITAETPTEVTIQRKDNAKSETVSVRDVKAIKYEGGKAAVDFQQAEIFRNGNEYQKASDAYSKIAQDHAGKQFLARAAGYGRVSTLVRQAQREGARVDEAIQALEEFRTQHPNSRYHFSLHEMLGQLYLGKGNLDAAGTAFGELAKAPWPDMKLKATIYDGRILIGRGQLDAAIAKFDEVAASTGDSNEEKIRRFEALVGKGECLVKQKKFDEVEKLMRQVIDECSSEEASIHASAFNSLGDAYRETGKPKDAVMAYLQVDLLYSGDRNEHAKSLCYLALLWEQLGRADRAADNRDRLKKDYPNSEWVKVMESGGKDTNQ